MMKRTRLVQLGSGLVLGVLLCCAGCGGKEESANQIPEPDKGLTDAAGNKLVLDAEALQIDKLAEHKNPIIAQNAIKLREAFASNDYTRAAYALGSIASIRVDRDSETIIRDALQKLREVATAAAAKGDKNAEFALSFLKDMFG